MPDDDAARLVSSNKGIIPAIDRGVTRRIQYTSCAFRSHSITSTQASSHPSLASLFR